MVVVRGSQEFELMNQKFLKIFSGCVKNSRDLFIPTLKYNMQKMLRTVIAALVVCSAIIIVSPSVAMAQIYNVQTAQDDNQDLAGVLLAGATQYDGLLWNLGADYNLNQFTWLVNESTNTSVWYTGWGTPANQLVFGPLENLSVQGNGSSDFLLFTALDALGPGIPENPPFHLTIRNLNISDAQFKLDNTTDAVTVDLLFDNNSSLTGRPNTSALTLNNGAFVGNFRSVTSRIDIDFAIDAQSGVNQIYDLIGAFSSQSNQVTVAPGATLEFLLSDTGAPVEFAANTDVAVDNGVLKVLGYIGASELKLGAAGANSFTLHNGATLQVGDGGSSAQLTYGGDIIGAAPINISNSMVQVATGATLSSNVTANTGSSIDLGSGATIGIPTLVVSGDTTVTSRAGTNRTEIGSFTQVGGTLTLSGGDFNVSGAANVFAGSLELTPSTADASEVTFAIDPAASFGMSIGAASALSGTGTVNLLNGRSLSVAGTLRPGETDTIGLLAVNGNGSLEFAAGSTFDVTIDPTAAVSDLVALGDSSALIIDPTAMLSISVINDMALDAEETLTLLSYTEGNWNGQTFEGLPDGASIDAGWNSWVIDYDAIPPALSPDSTIRTITLTASAPDAIPTLSLWGMLLLLLSLVWIGYRSLCRMR
jgi:hypothetical protein